MKHSKESKIKIKSILIIAIIILAIVGVWMIRNKEKQEDTSKDVGTEESSKDNQNLKANEQTSTLEDNTMQENSNLETNENAMQNSEINEISSQNSEVEENKSKDSAVEKTNSDFTLKATDDFDIEKLKSYHLPIIIDFGASYCPPCREMEPDLKELNSKYQGKAIIKYVDIEKYPKYAENYPMEFIPTQLLICSNGTPYMPSNAQELGLEFLMGKEGEIASTLHIGILTMEQMETMLKGMGLNE